MKNPRSFPRTLPATCHTFSRRNDTAFRVAIIWVFPAISLLAAEPAGSSFAGHIGAATRAFSAELDARNLTPEQRIAAQDEWRKTHGNPLTTLRAERQRTLANVPDPATVEKEALARQKEAIASKTGDEKELAQLQWDVADAIRQMRDEKVSPEKRIAMFDEFTRVNRDVFQDIRALRKSIGDQRLEAAPPIVIPPPRSEEEARLRGQREALAQELAAKRDALAKLTPEERIAAVDRDRDFYRQRIKALREIST